MEGNGSPCHYDGNSASSSEDEELPRRILITPPWTTYGQQMVLQVDSQGGVATVLILSPPTYVEGHGKLSFWEGGSVHKGGGLRSHMHTSSGVRLMNNDISPTTHTP